jgi:DNA-binding GntR family transcriptional regulator
MTATTKPSSKQTRKSLAEEGPSLSLQRFQATIRQILLKGDNRSSLVTDIASVVGAEILEGIRPPGSDLNSVELASSFNTSRTPTREAMVLLEKEGLVEIFPRRRPRVAVFSLPEIREIYQIRAAMLALMAEEIAKSRMGAGVLRQILADMEKAANANDRDGYFWSNVAFHETFARLPGNRTLERIIESLMLRSLRTRRLALNAPQRITRSLADHTRLVDALDNHESELAAALIRACVLSALTTLEEVLQFDPDPPVRS